MSWKQWMRLWSRMNARAQTPAAMEGVVLVAVSGNPEEQVKALRDLGDDSPYWRAAVLVATRLQGELLKHAMAQQGAERLARVSEAKGVAMLLKELDTQRRARGK
jgi:hypothetical protein